MAKPKRHHRPKGPTYSKELQARRNARDEIITMWSIQLTLDVMAGVLNDLYGLGCDRLTRMSDEFNRRLPEYMDALTKHPEADYIREKIDQQQRRIFGPNALTWAERYIYWGETK